MGQNIITINGNHYDAKTGQLLPGAHHTKGGGVIDGFTRRPHASKHVAPAHKVHSKTEKSKTLMRGAVKKPASQKVHAKAHATQHHKKAANKGGTPTNHARVERASGAPKSTLISRFGPATMVPASVHKTTAYVPVKHAPISEHSEAPIPGSFAANPFEAAIENANSHNEAKPKKVTHRHKLARKFKVSTRAMSFASFVGAGLLLGGFFVYQNIPNLAMRVASARSGVAASIPDYRPAGFAMAGPIRYSAGKISINYKSTTDERNYAITQSNTEWNDDALVDKFVMAENRNYQTYQDKGKTIYIYDDDSATWINNGVWYQVEGNSSLSSDQLLRIANSL